MGLNGVSFSDSSLLEMFGVEYMGAMGAVSNVLSNARVAKATLRRTWQAWQSLHGETDFDDLLVANVLRSAAPEAYTFLSRRVSELRKLATTEGVVKEEREKCQQRLKDEWDNIVKNAEWNGRAASILVDFLFPSWKEPYPSREYPLQGITISHPDDYWIRLNEEELSEGTLRDQEVLREITRWRSVGDSRESSDLVPRILNIKGYAPKVEQFGTMFSGDEVRSLAAELFELILQSDYRLGRDEQYSGFIELWRLAIRKPVEKHEEWAFEQIKKALPIDLHFADELYYYWRTNDRSRIRTGETTPELRKKVVEEAQRIFSAPSALVSAINQKIISSVFHLVIGASDSSGNFPEYDPMQFKGFGKVLLQAFQENPQIMLPQVAFLITTYAVHGPMEERVLRFDDEKIHDLFEGHEETLMHLLTTDIDLSALDDDSRSWVLFAQEEARKQLNVHASSS